MRSLRRQLPAEADPSKFVAATRRYTIASYEPTRLARILCARPVIGSLIATAVANPNQFHQGCLSGGIARVGLRGSHCPPVGRSAACGTISLSCTSEAGVAETTCCSTTTVPVCH